MIVADNIQSRYAATTNDGKTAIVIHNATNTRHGAYTAAQHAGHTDFAITETFEETQKAALYGERSRNPC